MNKRVLLCIAAIIFFLSLSTVSHATHIMGGSINYTYLGLDSATGNYRYQITIYLFRLCDSGSSLLPIDMNLGVYENDTTNPGGDKLLVLNTVIPLIIQQPVEPPNANDSCTFAPNVCVEEGIYQDIISVPPNNIGYYFISDRCCRNNNIVNLDNPGNAGEAYFAFAPAPSIVNSSPTFAVDPVPFICNTDTVSVLNQAFDPDGDSLVYNFVVPYNGISTGGNPNPNPPVVYPYPVPLVAYAPGYSLADPFGATGYISMNSTTGLAQYYSPNQGFYVIAVEISEYRNGVLIGISRRDIQIIVIPCPVNPAPVLSTGTSQTTFTIEEGDTLCFNTTFDDPNGDSIFIAHIGDIFNIIITNPAATFIDSSGAGTATGQFCWITSCDQGSSIPYQFTVVATDNGCPAKVTNIVYTINVQNTIKPPFIIGPDTLCSSNSFGIIYSVNQAGDYTYFWTIDNGTIIGSNTGDSVLVNFNGTGTSVLSVSAVNHNGCLSDSTSQKVVISPNPSAVAGPDITFCSGDTATLGTTSTGGYTYLWTPGTGLSSTTISDPVVTLNNTGSTPITITYIVTTTLGSCTNSDTVVVTVNPRPAPAGGPDVALCSGDTVTIGTPNVAGNTYSWTPPTGLSSDTISDPTVTLTDTTGLPYTVQYIVVAQNSYGCTSIDTVNVTVNVLPVAVAGNDTSFCSGDPVSIGGPSVTGYSYLWVPSAGLNNNTISDPIVTHVNTSGQNDTLYFTLTATAGTCTDQDSVMVIVRPSPVSNAGPDQLLCGTDTVQLGTSTTVGYTYLWTPPTGLNSDTISDPILIVTNSGTTPDTLVYIVTTNLNGCITTDTVQIISAPGPSAAAGPDTSYCSGSSVVIGSTSQANYTYNWTPAGGLSSTTISNPTVTLTNTSGVPDTVYYTVTVNLFGCLATDSVMVIVNPSPVSNAGPDQFLCSGGTVQLGTATTTGYIYSWSPSTGLSSTVISDPDLTLTNTGTDPDTLIYIVTTTLNGCTTSDTVQVIVSPVPSAVAGPDTVICSGNSVVIGSTATPNYVYTWIPATGLSSTTVSNPTLTLTNTSGVPDTVYYIVSVDLFGCPDADTVMIIVKPNPISNAGPDVTLCGGDTIQLGTTSTVGYTYSWTPSNGLSSTTISDPILIVSNTGTTPITLTYTVTTSLDGCTTTDDVTITVNPQPTVTAFANPLSICIGDSTALNATGATSYSWALSTAPGNPISTDSVFVVSPVTTTTYILTGTNGFSCSNTTTITITVNQLPPVQIASAPLDSLCAGDTLTLSATGATNYTWSILGGGNIGTGSSIQVSPTANTTYVVIGTDGNTCTNSDTISIIVNPAATLTSISGTVSVCPGVTGVQYWINNPNPNSTYVWIVTLGTITSGQNTDTITVDWSTTSGGGSVSVIEVTDHGCQSDPVILPVTINVLLTPVAPTGPTTLCANEAQGIIYNALNTPGSTYNWNAQGGVIAGGNGTSTVTVDWTVPGPQVVALWYDETSITAVDTCFGTSDTLYVTINPAPATSPISGPLDACISDSGSFSVVSTSGSTYNWLINGGTILSGNGTNAITADWPGAGTVTVSVIETNSYGCVGDTVSITVTVHSLPAANAGADVDVCTGQGVQLTASGGVSYVWDPPTGLSSTTIANPIASPVNTTSYTVFVTDVYGCKNSDTVLVTVNGLPNITLTPNSAVCIGNSIQLNAGGGNAYHWSPGGSLNNPNISNPVATPNSTTTYTVIVTDQNTCVDSASVTITVNALPVIIASIQDTIICDGASTTLSASGGVSYSWSPPDNLSNANIQNPVANPPVNTIYTVTGTDANGCSNSDNVKVWIHVVPQASFIVNDGTLGGLTCEGYSGSLQNTSVDALDYQWIFPDGSTSPYQNPNVQLNLSGNNTITLIAYNKMCSDTTSIDFMSTAIDQLFGKMPNIFTPNGDDHNDRFKLGSIIHLENCSEWEVYNRWGERVFKSSPSVDHWNGMKDNTGKLVPEGTYYLVLKIADKSYKGTITLIRSKE